MLTVAHGRGGKICQNLADVICERSLKGEPEGEHVLARI